MSNTSGQEHSAATWLATRSGKRLDPFHPQPEAIAIEDIAFGLARKFRYSGQTDLTVAQHCVLCSLAAARHFTIESGVPAWALLHDAAEAPLFDVPRPVKPTLGWMFPGAPGCGGSFLPYDAVERRILRAVAVRFGLPSTMPAAVKQIDSRMLATEKRDLFGGNAAADTIITSAEPFADLVIVCWSLERAEAEFLKQFHAVVGEHHAE